MVTYWRLRQAQFAHRMRPNPSFEEVVLAIEADRLLAVVQHPGGGKYPNQLVIIVALDGYALLVPFVEMPEYNSLKTVIPSRKASRDYLLRRNRDETS